jgi:hypothetical protein
MGKIDFKKQLKELYSASAAKISIVEVPDMNYLSIDGQGDPNNSQEFSDAVEALYSVAYSIKFDIKKSKGTDFGVMPLEGLWWCNEIELFSMNNKREWKWTLQVMQPNLVSESDYKKALTEVAAKKKLLLLSKIRYESYCDGLAVQVLHIGPYDNEESNIKRLHTFIDENGFSKTGKHREIYLSDARKTAPDRLKTILRQPIMKK